MLCETSLKKAGNQNDQEYFILATEIQQTSRLSIRFNPPSI